ncbi:MAG: polysaccharide deacetylase family protein [Firmicutes bacterium]|nr:polysaccharide deacetylase family protein [Bacillota bacterium]
MDRQTRLKKRKQRYLVALLLFLLILSFFLHKQITAPAHSPLIEGAYYRVETKEKACTFTFEVVWGSQQFGNILNILDRHQISATFFVDGAWLRKHADLAREILIRGHEIGLHGYEHKLMTEMDDEELAADFTKAVETLQKELNIKTNLFRPPFGELDRRVFNYAHSQGFITVLWSINTQDWLNLTRDQLSKKVVKSIHPGAIILMHTHSAQLAKALPVIIQSLQQQEYEIVPFSELLQRELKNKEDEHAAPYVWDH